MFLRCVSTRLPERTLSTQPRTSPATAKCCLGFVQHPRQNCILPTDIYAELHDKHMMIVWGKCMVRTCAWSILTGRALPWTPCSTFNIISRISRLLSCTELKPVTRHYSKAQYPSRASHTMVIRTLASGLVSQLIGSTGIEMSVHHRYSHNSILHRQSCSCGIRP